MERSDKELLEWLRGEVIRIREFSGKVYLCNTIENGRLDGVLLREEKERLSNIIALNIELAREKFNAIDSYAYWYMYDYDNRIAFLDELIRREV